MRLVVAILIATVATVASSRAAHAQKACEHLLPPSGVAIDVAIHASYLTQLAFPEKLASANTSAVRDYEIRADGVKGLLVKPRSASASPANIVVVSGAFRISVSFHIATGKEVPCALVTFKLTTEEEARQHAIDEAVAARTAALETQLAERTSALEAQLAAMKRDQADLVRAQLDRAVADRAVARLDLAKLSAVERNGAGVVVWAMRALYLGPDVLVNLEIDNRSRSTARIAAVELEVGGKNVATAARFTGGESNGAIGTVASGAKLRGLVYARDVSLGGKEVALVVRFVDGSSIKLGRLGLR